jgi:hypothetical protein
MSRRGRLPSPAVWGTALVILAVAGGAAVWRFVLRDDPRPETVARAIEEFREGAAAGAAGRGPEPGVYVYATTGAERIDVLTRPRHRYPPETTITVTRTGCGVRYRWRVLQGRSNSWLVCPRAGGEAIVRTTDAHRFLGRDDVGTDACTGLFWLPGAPKTGAAWSGRCSGKDPSTARGEVIALERLSVAGTEVGAVHVREVRTYANGTTGTETRDWWLAAATGLPLRAAFVSRTVSPSPIGDVTYTETAELVLTSLEPRR